MLHFDKIPNALKERPQWVLWRNVIRDGKSTKVPYGVNGRPAKANDPATWSSYDDVVKAFDDSQHAGIGYEFAADDPFVGIDLDGCREPVSGVIADWAKEIITSLDTYAEVSPSETGVKLFVCCELRSDWRKVVLDVEPVCDKAPAIEVYDRARYFAVTGARLTGPAEPQQAQIQLDWLIQKYKPKDFVPQQPAFNSAAAIVDRARKYLATMPPAVSGQRGHDVTFRAACVLVQGFLLDRGDAIALLAEWNLGCQPPWSEREIEHKVSDAQKAPGERGYLRDVQPSKWGSIRLPEYKAPAPKSQPRLTTIDRAATKYLENLKAGKETLIDTGLPDLDYVIGGGVEPGEMVILAARPSHGKSAVALQCIHHWTSNGLPTLLISEEMSELAIGKRTLQFLTDVPGEHWRTSLQSVERDIEEYAKSRAKCYIVEGCRTADIAAEQIEMAVREFGVRCVVVDYAGLLRSEGKSRYEQMTNTSVTMRQAASQNKVVLLLQCQLSREIEKRPKFLPMSSDLRDTGQLEQDADLIVFCCWPHRIDSKNDPFLYQFFVTKNRNRGINGGGAVQCRFEPSRQMFMYPKAKDMANYESSFDDWNEA